MARAAAKRTKRPSDAAREKPKGARKPPPPPKPVEKTLFFNRLRGGTKWVFAVLAVVFALSFVVAGVGSGSSGFGSIVDALGGIFGTNNPSSSETSVSDAQERIAKNPKDAQAYRDLARAYELRGETDLAIEALEDYLKLPVSRENRISALNEIAGLYETRAREQGAVVQAALVDLQTASGAGFAPDPTSPLGKALDPGQDPIRQAQQQAAQVRYQQAAGALQQTYLSLQNAYKRLTQLDRSEPSYVILYAQASINANDRAAAIAAYKDFLKRFPDDPSAASVRDQLKQLEAAGS